jgi:hypothetical protein
MYPDQVSEAEPGELVLFAEKYFWNTGALTFASVRDSDFSSGERSTIRGPGSFSMFALRPKDTDRHVGIFYMGNSAMVRLHVALTYGQ